MSGNSVMQAFEHSSRESPNSEADPYLMLLRTMDVPSPDVANVVRLIGDARNIAKNADPRISPLLMDDVRTYIEALTSLTSVGGKGLKFLTTTMQKLTVNDTSGQSNKMGMRELIHGEGKYKRPAGIPIGDD